MSTDATDKKLTALLKRLQRLADQIARTRAESAKTRKLVEAVERKIARARAALQLPPVGCEGV
jgi:chorismate mutase